jgi:signal transduction histidine kinase
MSACYPRRLFNLQMLASCRAPRYFRRRRFSPACLLPSSSMTEKLDQASLQDRVRLIRIQTFFGLVDENFPGMAFAVILVAAMLYVGGVQGFVLNVWAGLTLMLVAGIWASNRLMHLSVRTLQEAERKLWVRMRFGTVWALTLGSSSWLVTPEYSVLTDLLLFIVFITVATVSCLGMSVVPKYYLLLTGACLLPPFAHYIHRYAADQDGYYLVLILLSISWPLVVLRKALLVSRSVIGAIESNERLRDGEGELLRHRNHLAEIVAERTAELLAAKNAAEQAHRIKSEFLANISHELRTPLHSILSFARLGQEKLDGQAGGKTQRYFSRIVGAGERLLAMVSNLLDLSKIEAGKLLIDPQPCDLVVLVRDVVGELEALAAERKLQWHLPSSEAHAVAAVDPVRFSQVLRNVLSNAMKFSAEGGDIRVLVDETTMTLGRRTDDPLIPIAAWRISVIDEGIGIPEDELEMVFDSFVQSSKTRTGAGGTGLGLTICREIVGAHRGSISARNRPEGGAIFEILVPSSVPVFARDGSPGTARDSARDDISG